LERNADVPITRKEFSLSPFGFIVIATIGCDCSSFFTGFVGGGSPAAAAATAFFLHRADHNPLNVTLATRRGDHFKCS
jgi:hypothetical protein